MTLSFHTEPERLLAAGRIKRDDDGRPVLPPILARKPRRGDVHPIAVAQLTQLLRGTLPEYLYGLKRVELRPRRSDAIGEPFGSYLVREKTIVLYSLPIVWKLSRLTAGWQECLQSYGAVIKRGDDIAVSWKDDGPGLMLWFWDTVVIHELGHHHVEQYKRKNGRVRTRKAHEALADMHVGRYLSRRFQRLKQRSQRPAAQ